MANQNLFERYGIKEVADVTFYRIEREQETFETQRTIEVSSILKGALKTTMVYPLTSDGVGAEEGFEAYVVKDVDILTGVNYDCDDEVRTSETYKYKILVPHDLGASLEVTNYYYIKKCAANDNKLTLYYNDTDNATTATPASYTDNNSDTVYIGLEYENDVIKNLTSGEPINVGNAISELQYKLMQDTFEEVTIDVWQGYTHTASGNTVKVTKQEALSDAVDCDYLITLSVNYNVTHEATSDLDYGIYNNAANIDPDPVRVYGTHEYSYAKQICLNFAKNQNLITKAGLRYNFHNADSIFGDKIVFNDNFAGAPSSTEKVVVCGLSNCFNSTAYSFEEVNSVIKQLSEKITAKAYDIVYNQYAEVIVQNEMGYFKPNRLYTSNTVPSKNDNGEYLMPWRNGASYDFKDNYENNKSTNTYDSVLYNAVAWGDETHFSINDAIDALKAKAKVLDQGSAKTTGLKGVFGGYKVSSSELEGNADLNANNYSYSIEGQAAQETINGTTSNIVSKYCLDDVIKRINTIMLNPDYVGKNLKVTPAGEGGTYNYADPSSAVQSNRAIWVDVSGGELGTGSRIYLMHNLDYRRLSDDRSGVFTFTDYSGNTMYYQDEIFKGIEYLALVMIGNYGLIFVVDRHKTTNINKVAWVVNETGYPSPSLCDKIMANGLIHTLTVTDGDESFDAICVAKSMTAKKTTKTVLKYVPVLFLDTLKVSTIEQTAEDTSARGGKGNTKFIVWDYGKEITLNLTDALYSPASMSAMIGSYEGSDFTKGVKETKKIDRMEKCTAKRSFVVPAGNSEGFPSEGDLTSQAVYIDIATMQPYQDGAPIAEGETYLKFTRSIAYGDNSLGNTIEISAEKFPGTYKIVGDTYARNEATGQDQRFQFVIPRAKMSSEQTITLEAEGDPSVFDMKLTVLRPDDGKMLQLIQYDVVENEEENDGSTMIKGTENLNLLDDAEMYRVNTEATEETTYIGSTEY